MKVRDREDALASTRDACATQMRDRRLLGAFFRGGGWVLRPHGGQCQGNDDSN